MANSKNTSKFKHYLAEQNIEFSFDRIVIKALSGMAQGLFASLLIGTILGTIGTHCNIAFLNEISAFTIEIQGAAMAIAIGHAIGCPPLVLFSLATVGFAANYLGGAGGPLAVYFVGLIASLAGKLVSKRTAVDIILTPSVTIIIGVAAANLIAPPAASLSSAIGGFIIWATNMQPFIMGIIISVTMGIVLTLPISSAAICAALGLVGLAGGAALAGCAAHMVGFAVCSYRENKLNGLLAQGLGTSMLQISNLMKKPILWLPPVIASAITGPIATVLFNFKMNGVAIASGMGTSGFVGPIGVISGWSNPSEAAILAGETAINSGLWEWLGLVLICIVLPALISLAVSEMMRKAGWIKLGDYKLTDL